MYYVHGRWIDPNVGRFISPDEKGEYLYGSGEDAVNYVWAAGQGAICQFVNDEALGEPAVFDQFLQGITNGERVTGYTTLCVENQGGDAFNFGTYFGRGTSYAVSVVEIVGGVDMIVGGGIGGAVTCPVTLGGGCVAGAGAVVVGAAGVVHGGAVLVRNLNAPMMMAKSKGGGGGANWRETETGEQIRVRKLSDAEVKKRGWERLKQQYGFSATDSVFEVTQGPLTGKTYIGGDKGFLIEFP